MPSPIDAAALEDARLKRVRYYCGWPERNIPGHLFAFCVDILGYNALSPEFHGPLLAAWDAIDLKRFRQYEGLQDYGKEALDTLDLWPRGHIKTWAERARVLRYYVWNSGATVTWWHAVEAKAIESGDAIAQQLLQNDTLRELFPAGVLPARTNKKFYSGGKFNLRGRRIGDGPSLLCLGAGAEGTGGHSLVGVLDDFVARNDVDDSQMPKKLSFYQSTVSNVVLSQTKTQPVRGWVDVIGTRWSEDDPYGVWLASKAWISTVRACLETDGKPDDKGTPVYLTPDAVERAREAQGPHFPYQMMNDPLPPGDLPWDRETCEHFIESADAKGCYIYVVHDPAPARQGSLDGTGARLRGDGSKDFWAIAVIGKRVKGQRKEMLLLDLRQSREWDFDEGLREGARLQRKWGARKVAIESVGSGGVMLSERMRTIAREEGVKYSPVELTVTNRGKNTRFSALCSRAKADEFLIADSVPAEIRQTFLEQARAWRPLPNGRNGLKYDDLADVVSYATDPALDQYARSEADEEWSPFRKREEDGPTQGTRYVSW
jgi:hypothetical protein